MARLSSFALGLMSGTSADGLSLAFIEVASRSRRRLKVLEHGTFPYPAALQRRILAASKADARELARLHFDLGRLYADIAARFLSRHGIAAKTIAAVGSHGQTVIHLPDDERPATLQIGEPSFLAERLGVPVVSDFRPRDMAAGGQGAPLVPFLDDILFGDGPPRALQNIGGIGNVALVGSGVRPVGFDTGPGNCLMDLAVRRITRGRASYDKDGRMARRGAPNSKKIESLLRLSYFRRRPPKSIDRNAFGEGFLNAHFNSELKWRPFDVLATLTDFTAATIADAYRRFIFPKAKVMEVVVGGGGALNPVLMSRLEARLSPVLVKCISDYGVPSLAKEPAAFALMAWLAVAGKINHLPQATGARAPRILGKITP